MRHHQLWLQLFTLVTVSHGFQWPSFSNLQLFGLGKPAQPAGLTIAEMLPAEIDAVIQNMETLDGYNHRPDCFRQAAKGIRGKCSDLEMNEEERIRAAISMTLCELATAEHHSPPLECQPFLNKEEAHLAPYATCVEAFSRSAQHWSSYSGYLRQVPQLCFAYRRWNEIDTAKALYFNATMEQLAFLKLLKKREGVVADQEDSLSSSLKDLVTTITRLEQGTGQLEEFTGNMETRSKQLLDEMQANLLDAIMKAESSLKDSHRSLDEELTSILSRSENTHSQQLQDIIKDTQSLLKDNANSVMKTMQDNTAVLAGATLTLQRDWSALGDTLNLFRKTIESLNDATERVAIEIANHAEQAAETRELNYYASQSFQALAASIDTLTRLTHSELHAINATAAAVKYELAYNADSMDWWTALILKVMRMSGEMGFADLELASDNPWLRTAAYWLWMSWRIGKWLLSPLISSIIFTKSLASCAQQRRRKQREETTKTSVPKVFQRSTPLSIKTPGSTSRPASVATNSVKPSPISIFRESSVAPSIAPSEPEEFEDEGDTLGPLALNPKYPPLLHRMSTSATTDTAFSGGRAISEPPARKSVPLTSANLTNLSSGFNNNGVRRSSRLSSSSRSSLKG